MNKNDSAGVLLITTGLRILFFTLTLAFGSASLADSAEYNTADPNLTQFKPKDIREVSGEFCLQCFFETPSLDLPIFPQQESFLKSLKQLEDRAQPPL